jgi:hypothetical protein
MISSENRCPSRIKSGTGFFGIMLYSTVTDFARFRGWSTSVPMNTAVW